MKKIASILVMICISLTINAQKCKFDYEKKDPFTGKLTSGITATLARPWKIGFNKAGDNYSIGLFTNFAGAKEDIINEGDTLMFALENGNPIILVASDKALPTSDVIGSQIQTWYRPLYIADVEQIRQLSLNKIIAVKIYLGTWYSLEIPLVNAQKIMQAASCILK